MAPSEVESELKRALPHLRLLLPVAAGAVWLVRWLRAGRVTESTQLIEAVELEEEGMAVALELPTAAPRLPFRAPPPLPHALLDMVLPLPLPALWQAVFGSDSNLLAEFHQQVRDYDIEYGPWLQRGDRRWRVLTYTTPLSQPFGPKQAFNKETMEAVQLSPTGFHLRSCCTTTGVPFSGNFTNNIEWVAVAHSPSSVRLIVSGECRFHRPVWGPLKGQIQRESAKGMIKAYNTLASLLTSQFGGVAAGGAALAVARGSQAAAASGAKVEGVLGNPHTSAATLIMLFVFVIILYRFTLLNQAATVALMQRVAAAARR